MKYFTSSRGIGGRLRQRISDFSVEEIPPQNILHVQFEKKLKEKKFGPAGEHTIFWMEKFNWDTHQALRALAEKLHASPSRFGIAGTKDKRAITRQRVSAWKISQEQLEKIKIRDIKLYDFEPADKKLQLGDSGGNKFEIITRDIGLGREEIEKMLSETFSQLQNGVPNIFGPQRFGEVRKITHLVGLEILRGDFEQAVKIYLTKVFSAEPEDSKEARKFLSENWHALGFRAATQKFPARLRYECAICNYLSQKPDDFVGAFKTFPKKLQKMFVNAFQAFIWNECACELWNKKIIVEKIKIFGHETKLSSALEDKIISDILTREKIKSENFQIKEIRDISSKGGEREFLLKPHDLKILEISDDEFNAGKQKVKISFSLPTGSYATVVAAEIMKTDNQ